MEDLDRIGGLPMVMKELHKAGLLNGKCMTCTGKTLEENLKEAKDRPTNQTVIASLEKPLASPLKHIVVMKGSLCPDGAVILY